MFKVLVWPKKAFAELYHQTTLREGIIIFILITIFSAIVNLASQLLLPTALFGGYSTLGSFNSEVGIYLYIAPIIAIPLGLLMLYLTGWLSAKFTKSIGRGFGDVEKTIGFFGYAAVVGLVVGIIQLIMIGAIILARGPIPESADEPMGAFENMFAILAFMLIIGVISFIWSLYVYGSAVSVANDVSLGEGVVSYFLASLIIGMIVGVIFFVISMMAFMAAGPM